MGRAMVREPAVFLFDEPLSNLDAGLRAQMRIEIGALQRRLRTTTLYVTHDQVEAMTLGDRIVVLADGRIQQVGRPIELYRAPVNRFVAGFIGTPPMNFLEGRILRGEGAPLFLAEGVRLRLPRDATVTPPGPGTVTLGIRPEELAIDTPPPASRPAAESSGGPPAAPSAGEAADALRGRVVLVERLGGASHVHFEVGPHRLMAVASDPLPEVGACVTVRLRAGRVHLFGADGRVS
jgi:ABC-type sugar transport system ATPase subunit